MLFIALVASIAAGSFAGYKLRNWAAGLEKIEVQPEYAPSMEEDSYRREILGL